MRKTILFISTVIGGLSIIRLLLPGSPWQFVALNNDAAYVGVGVAFIAFLLELGWMHHLRIGSLLHALSFVALSTTLYGFISPTYSGFFPVYIHVADSFVLFESAVVLWLLGSAQRTDGMPPLAYAGYAGSVLVQRVSQRTGNLGSLQTSSAHHHPKAA